MADHTILQNSLEQQDTSSPFESKKWTYITDSSSNGGVFSGQIQFDLNTLSSQNQWTDLSEAYVQFPVKLSIASLSTAAATPTLYSATIKNGYHQFIDSVQVTIGGTTVQSSQIFENINTTFKMLTSWSTDEFEKYGTTLGLSMDDYQEAIGTSTPESLDNIAATALALANKGVAIPIINNPGYLERVKSNSSVVTTATAKAILGTNAAPTGKNQTQIDADGTVVAGADVFVNFALATVRLKDISDVCSKLPLIKNAKGFIYINYNAAQSAVVFTGTSAASGITSSSLFGRCQPGIMNAIGLSPVGGETYTFKAEVSGVASTTLTTALPTRSEARLYAPYFVASPAVDRALTMKKTIRYMERFVTQFTIAAGQAASPTLTPGITNPKMVVLFPLLTGSAGAAGLASFLANPLLSPFDTVPATTSPFAGIQNLQITVGNTPMYQNPVTMNFETFMNEVSQLGLDGSQDSLTTTAGLLDERKWNQLYRYYACNVGRRMGADDGASKSVQVSCTNSCGAPMTVIAWILYERELTIDTAMGYVTQNL